MHDSDLPPNVTPVDDEVIEAVDSGQAVDVEEIDEAVDAVDEVTAEAASVDPAEAELDEIAADLDTVEAAMKALDRDDMEGAESLAGSLAADPPADPEPTEA